MELSTEDKIRVVERAIEIIKSERCYCMCYALELSIEEIEDEENPYGVSISEFIRKYIPEFFATKEWSDYPSSEYWYVGELAKEKRINHLNRFLNELKEKLNDEQK